MSESKEGNASSLCPHRQEKNMGGVGFNKTDAQPVERIEENKYPSGMTLR